MVSSACCFRAAWRTLTRIFSVRTNISHPRRFCSCVAPLPKARVRPLCHPARSHSTNLTSSSPSSRSIFTRPGRPFLSISSNASRCSGMGPLTRRSPLSSKPSLRAARHPPSFGPTDARILQGEATKSPFGSRFCGFQRPSPEDTRYQILATMIVRRHQLEDGRNNKMISRRRPSTPFGWAWARR
jgi:hypothetical protein